MMNKPPDLQELIARHGGYDRIPPEAWAEYDNAVAQWRANRFAQIREEQYQLKNPRRPDAR